ncbi:MAG: hypothetical protein ACN6ON_08290, partial [Sphingobacterium sp.]
IGARNNIDLFSKFSTDYKGKLTSSENREWLSPPLTAKDKVKLRWIDQDILALGGEVQRVEIIDKQGDIKGCKLNIGYTNDLGIIVRSVDLSNVIFNLGIGTVLKSVVGTSIFADFDNMYEIIPSTLADSNGTFRIKIVYRVI